MPTTRRGDALRCYLCLDEIVDQVSHDHVPPKMFYAHEMRRQNDLQLFTLPTHTGCNGAYRLDEEYFVYSLAPLAGESVTGNAVLDDIAARFHQEGRNRPLANLTLEEFDDRIYFPHGKVVKRVQGQRIQRVAWKITRGLFCRQTAQFLPDRNHACQIYGSVERPPPQFDAVLAQPSLGDYRAVFDYKRGTFWSEKRELEIWAMLLWEKVIGFVMFHGLGCNCESCVRERTA